MNTERNLKQDNTEEAWEECLLLWKTLSEMKDTHTTKSVHDFKDSILIRIGIGKRSFGCPFCSKFNDTPHCPIGNCSYSGLLRTVPCFYTPYCEWHEHLSNFGKHNQKLAKDFYEYLLKLKESYDTNRKI